MFQLLKADLISCQFQATISRAFIFVTDITAWHRLMSVATRNVIKLRSLHYLPLYICLSHFSLHTFERVYLEKLATIYNVHIAIIQCKREKCQTVFDENRHK